MGGLNGKAPALKTPSTLESVAMFKHILLPVDGSDLSRRAIKLGIELAQTCHAKVYALHVILPYHAMASVAELLTATEEAYTPEVIARAERYLAEAQDLAKAAGVECHGGYVFNDHPNEAILEAVRAQHCDVVVMASHGRRGMSRMLLGSETHKVLLESPVPVLVCR